MINEINEAKEFLIKKFGSLENIKSGVYAVPTETSKGGAFMKVVVWENMSISDFTLWKDDKFKTSWYN